MIEELTRIVGAGQLLCDAPMSNYTTFAIGGPAQVLITPADEQSLIEAIDYCRTQGIPWYLMGRGSNLLVADAGIRGVVFRLCQTMDRVEIGKASDPDGTVTVTAGAGIMLSRLAQAAMEAGLSGLEYASGIPGTLGGALAMNAGAYGGEMKQVVQSVKVWSAADGVRMLDAGELEMGYRTSRILREGMIALSAAVCLTPGDPVQIRAEMDRLNGMRREKQPLEYPSAGSTFKRPPGAFAGKLIQDAGLKGYRVGGAQVSEKHAGFVINTGGATAADVVQLMQDVSGRVRAQFDITLEPEVRLIGSF